MLSYLDTRNYCTHTLRTLAGARAHERQTRDREVNQASQHPRRRAFSSLTLSTIHGRKSCVSLRSLPSSRTSPRPLPSRAPTRPSIDLSPLEPDHVTAMIEVHRSSSTISGQVVPFRGWLFFRPFSTLYPKVAECLASFSTGRRNEEMSRSRRQFF